MNCIFYTDIGERVKARTSETQRLLNQIEQSVSEGRWESVGALAGRLEAYAKSLQWNAAIAQIISDKKPRRRVVATVATLSPPGQQPLR